MAKRDQIPIAVLGRVFGLDSLRKVSYSHLAAQIHKHLHGTAYPARCGTRA